MHARAALYSELVPTVSPSTRRLDPATAARQAQGKSGPAWCGDDLEEATHMSQSRPSHVSQSFKVVFATLLSSLMSTDRGLGRPLNAISWRRQPRRSIPTTNLNSGQEAYRAVPTRLRRGPSLGLVYQTVRGETLLSDSERRSLWLAETGSCPTPVSL